jgi:subtilisin family serine protease
MKNRALVLALLASFTLVAATDVQAQRLRSRTVANGSLLVRFKDFAAADVRQSVLTASRSQVKRSFSRFGLAQVQTSLPLDRAMALLRANPLVEYVEPDYIVQHDVGSLPNDERFPELWGLDNTGQVSWGTPDADIDGPEAWSLETGNTGVVVAVIDSGVDYTHPDIAANMFRNVVDCNDDLVDDDGNGFVDDCYGIDTVNGDSDPMDDRGHGTHVAGIIGAAGDNSVGVTGVTWSVGILACKSLDALGSGPISAAIACLDYVAGLRARGVNIVATNNSWGGGEFSQALVDAIQASGVLFVTTAGNSGRSLDGAPRYPCSYALESVVCTAATGPDDQRTPFSNYGAVVELAAPGQDILSLEPGGGYVTLSGTSMAAPYVTGVAALLFAHFPGIDASAARCRLLDGVDRLAGLFGVVSTGGRLNAYGALTTTSTACGVMTERPVVSAYLAIDEQPAAGVNATLSEPGTRFRVSSRTDEAGRVAFVTQTGGRYRLVFRGIALLSQGAIHGTVAVGDVPLANTEVLLRLKGSGSVGTIHTDAFGAFRFPIVPPGIYRIVLGPFTVP